MMKYLWHCVLTALKMFTFLLVAGGSWFKNRFFWSYSEGELAHLSREHARYEDSLREEAARKAQERDPTLKKGSPHPPRREP